MRTTPRDGSTVTRVRLRLLPWRPRWRTGHRVSDGVDLGDLGGLFDEPLGAVIGLVVLVLLLPFVLAVVLGLALLSVEVLALVPLGLLLLLGRLCHLRPWVLVVDRLDGRRELVEVVGVRAARDRRRELLAPVGSRGAAGTAPRG